MKNIDHMNPDNSLQKILSKSSSPQPSDDFTFKVMEMVSQLKGDEKSVQVYTPNIYTILLISAASIFVLVATYFYLTFSGISFLPQNIDFTLFPVFKTLFTYFDQLIGSFSISPVTWVILLGVVAIFLLERLIKKLHLLKTFNFSF
ncbi:MAG: hypothetical protein K9G76_11980 [Bacteroidales bacterium]|nr:hypothetical protein [Bacteroidales bacterium]MCF8405161.1 hypothetical protein [Bacteroidales bacterium]